MRTVIIAAVMIALLPATAYSQEHKPATRRTDEQKKQDAEIEKAYEEVTKGMKSQAAPAKPWDPWQTVRPTPTPADGAKR
jgi:hypothetical protein